MIIILQIKTCAFKHFFLLIIIISSIINIDGLCRSADA